MTRSYKKYPIAGITMAESDKKDKQIANRAYRAYIRELIHRCLYRGQELTKGVLDRRTVTNVYSFQKDGKSWYKNWPKVYRK